MLLTLATHSFAATVTERSQMLALPRHAAERFGLRGLMLSTAMLKGWSMPELEQLRDAADKAHCPCLQLVEDEPLDFASPDEAKRQAAAERAMILGRAAHRLGCNAVAIRVSGGTSAAVFDRVAAEVKAVMPPLERMELNLLIGPSKGFTDDPDVLTDLIKKIGGFRIGSLPDFAHAAATGDAAGTLRKLAPYAGAMLASIEGFDESGAHKGPDLAGLVEAIRSVGFTNPLAIDYRGKGDADAVIEQAQAMLQAAIDAGE